MKKLTKTVKCKLVLDFGKTWNNCVSWNTKNY